jgi:hypothetical protein
MWHGKKQKTDSASGQCIFSRHNSVNGHKKGRVGFASHKELLTVNCKLFIVSIYVPLALTFRNNVNVSGQISVHPILLDSITRTILGEEYRSLRSSIRRVLHSHVTSSLLGPYVLLSNLLSNILSLRSSLKVSDQVSHPYNNRQNYSSVYINP